jgi:hypothetical protein
MVSGIAHTKGIDMLEFASTTGELVDSLARELKESGVGSAYAEEIAKALVEEYATFEVPPSRPGTLGAIIGRYAIRKDEIKLFDALTDGLKTAAGVEFFAGHQPALSAKVALGVSLAKLIRSFLQRGAILDRDTVHVLTILKCNADSPEDLGLTVEEILKIAQRTKPDCDLARIEHRLDFLRTVPTRDGGTTMLASQDGLGKWRSHT